MTAIDWNGREIQVGDTVRHAYEPWPGNETPRPGRGYHAHYFQGTARVIEIHGGAVILNRRCGISRLFAAALLEVTTENAGGGTSFPLPAPIANPNAAEGGLKS